MTPIWLLVIILSNGIDGGTAVHHIEMSSELTCKNAVVDIVSIRTPGVRQDHERPMFVKALCIKK